MNTLIMLIKKIIKVTMALFIIPLTSYAQENHSFPDPDTLPDSFHQNHPLNNEIQSRYESYYVEMASPFLTSPANRNSLENLNPERKYNPVFQTNQLSLFKGEYNVSGVIKSFRHGTLTGAGKQENLPGLGTFNVADISYIHSFNSRIAIQVNLNAAKFNSYFHPDQFFGAGMILSYKLRDNLSFNAFGNYSAGQHFNFSSYGAYLSIDVTERFGTDLGIQRYFDPMQKRWNTVPIIAPYYKFSNKVQIGMDFGGVLQEAARKLIK